jgi:hypothetical protein
MMRMRKKEERRKKKECLIDLFYSACDINRFSLCRRCPFVLNYKHNEAIYHHSDVGKKN